MSGCFITVAAMRPEEWHVNHRHQMLASVLAFWRTGCHGTRWLDQLVEDRKALKLKDDGYPSRWTALALAVLPMLRPLTHTPILEQSRVLTAPPSWPPALQPRVLSDVPGVRYIGMIEAKDHSIGVITDRYIYEVQFNCDLIAQCPPAQILTIDCWDAS